MEKMKPVLFTLSLMGVCRGCGHEDHEERDCESFWREHSFCEECLGTAPNGAACHCLDLAGAAV